MRCWRSFPPRFRPPRPSLQSSAPVEGGHADDEAHETGEGLLPAQGGAAEAFDPLDEMLDLAAFGVKAGVQGRAHRRDGCALPPGNAGSPDHAVLWRQQQNSPSRLGAVDRREVTGREAPALQLPHRPSGSPCAGICRRVARPHAGGDPAGRPPSSPCLLRPAGCAASGQTPRPSHTGVIWNSYAIPTGLLRNSDRSPTLGLPLPQRGLSPVK